MAEAIGTIAAVETMLHIARKLEEYARDCYFAPEQQDELGRAVDDLKDRVEILSSHVKRAIENPDDERFAAVRKVLKPPTVHDSSDARIKHIENDMKNIENELISLSGNNIKSRIKRLWWHHDKEKFQNTIKKIKGSIEQVESVFVYCSIDITLITDDNIKKVLKSLATEAENRTTERKEDVDEREKARKEQAQASKEQAQAMEWLILERQRAASEREREFKEKKIATLIKWLSPLTFRKRQAELYNQCTQQNVSTPSLLESPEFAAWTSGRPWTLRCDGEPGAGKTFVCALAVERLKTIFQGQDVPILCLYLNYKESEAQTLGNLISSLLKQLLQHTNAEFKSPAAKRLFSGVENESRPTLEAFYEAFLAEIRYHERVMIVVDAYDEAPLAVQTRLADRLEGLPTEKVSLMVTLRPTVAEESPRKFCDICGRGKPIDDSPPLKLYHRCETCDIDICSECRAEDKYCANREHKLEEPDEVRMRIEPSRDDIWKYVEKELETELRLGKSKHNNSTMTKSSFGTTRLGRICQRRPDLKEKIIAAVVEKADSMFTLADLYMQTFKACIEEEQVEDALDDPPEGYDGFYERNMLRITTESENPRDSALARKTLEWVVHAYRPLSLEELRVALAVDLNKAAVREAAKPDKATILEATAGMIIIDPDEKSVRLNHRTAQEYFDKSRDRWFKNPSASLTRILLHYISLGELTKPCGGINEDKDFDARRKSYPLLDYAYPYWGDHAREAGLHSEIQEATLQYIRDPDKIAAWTQAAWYLRSAERAEWDIRKGANALHVCAWFGLTNVVSRLLEEGLDINAADPTYEQTPLMYACRRGQSATVAKLLESGADINHYSQRNSVALFEAIDSGVMGTVDLLLSDGYLDENAGHRSYYNRTALMLAAQGGMLEIVDALLHRSGTKLDEKDSDGNTALALATIAGQSKIVATLVEHEGLGIDLQNSYGSSALILAAAASGRGKDALAMIDIATDLLKKGAKTSIKDHEGGTAILRAVDAGNEVMVQLLLDYDADILVRDGLNRGLLHSAAIGGYDGIVQLLLEKKSEVDAQDQNGKTPLHDAGRSGNHKVASRLLNSGADQSIKDKQGRTPWTIAWQYGHLNVIRILDGEDIVEEKIEEDSYPQVRSLPIWSLVNLGFEQGVKELIDTKPNEIYFCDPDMGNTALHCAINANNPTILTLLLRAGLSPDARNDYHRTPLHLAAIAGQANLLTILLDHHAKYDEKDRWLQTPLEIAYNNHHLECAVILVEAGTVPARNMIQILFFASIELGRRTAVKKLIELRADLSSKNALGQTALQMAKEAGREEIVEMLRANKSFVWSPRVRSSITEIEEGEDEAVEKMAMLSIKNSPFHKPEVWDEEENEDKGTVVADTTVTPVFHAGASERRVQILESAV